MNLLNLQLKKQKKTTVAEEAAQTEELKEEVPVEVKEDETVGEIQESRVLPV